MTVESIDKLREYGHDCCARIDDAIHDHADEIEAEISERYMPLPLDADGVTIRIGDMLENKFSDYGCLAVHGYTETCALCHKVPPADLETYYVEFTNAHHVKPRTIEDVLNEYYDQRGWDEADNCAMEAETLTAKYADEIREVLGVGE